MRNLGQPEITEEWQCGAHDDQREPNTLERHVRNSNASLKTMQVKVPADQAGEIEFAFQGMVSNVNAEASDC